MYAEVTAEHRRQGVRAMEYVLKNKELEVHFQSFGGALSSIKDKEGIEFLWQGEKQYWSGQAPVLFPICGSIRDDKVVTESGKILSMPRHGIVRKKEFTCTGQLENQITFAIESDEEMMEQYPYPFRLEITYTLIGKTIQTKYQIYNKGSEVMPFQIGGHPGFNCPLMDGEEYNDYKIEFAQNEECEIPTPVTETGLIDIAKRTPFLKNQNELSLSHKLFAVDAVILDQLKSRSVKLISKNHKKGIQLDFADFPYLILWSTANNGPFVAIEPWIGLSTCNDEGNVFEEKRNIQKAEAGEIKEYQFEVTILG